VGNIYKIKVCDFGLSVIKPSASLKDSGGAKACSYLGNMSNILLPI